MHLCALHSALTARARLYRRRTLCVPQVPFVENNVKSTLHLLEFARRLPKLKNFVYFSTDEVREASIAFHRLPSPFIVIHHPLSPSRALTRLAQVYGSAAEGEAFKEGDAHKPSNP